MKHKYIFLLFTINFFILANDKMRISSIEELSSLPSITMPLIDNDEQLAKDGKKSFNEGIPLRYAEMTEVNFNTYNSGEWSKFDENYYVWKLNILSSNAVGLKLLFNQFKLYENDLLYIYNKEQDMIVGPLTANDNNIDNTFGHKLLKGDSIYIEYFKSVNNEDEPQLQINHVIHAYRDIHGYYENRDRECGENVACASSSYDDMINSAIYLEMNQYICSASLINNTNQDLTPYVLTAYHCVDEDGELGSHNNFTFYFNHQSSSCSGSSGNYGYSRTGSYIRAWKTASSSDVALLEMDDTPPSYFDAYYAGWSRESSASIASAGIHHPGGAPKQINYDNDTVYSCSWYSGGTHWCLSWDDGGTSGGSSGSPLFNNDNHIIGQLSGGNVECGGTDYYGKFSTSWNGSTSSGRLKDWLDPEDTNLYTLDGTYDGVSDNDGDGVDSDIDTDDNNQYQCSDDDDDTCDDCTSGSYNIFNDGWDYDGDGICDYGDSDDDNDNALDGNDSDDNNEFVCSDIDGDGCEDCFSGIYDPSNDGCNYADISFDYNTNALNELAINLFHQVPIAGFQFNLVDSPDCINLENAYGGEAANEGFTVSTSEPEEYGIVLGFSMTGATINPGNHILTNLIYSGNGDCEVCIEDVTISDQEGDNLIVDLGTCIPINNIILGDINNDGVLNVIDVVIVVDNILYGAEYNFAGDINSDGIVNISDVVILIENILN